ncbi:outer membrane beta-barrel protein [Melioribacteraceae bacterium 4301-Me]|uniref:outer membrane beta-barrel protein n=1 Tax=Pyranulibacter aquaticus TaxID=3163344 RepID=UPI003597E5FE
MKRSISITVILLLSLFANSDLFSQNRFSVGVVGSWFNNSSQNNRISEINNPSGYGIILGYSFNKNLTLAFTGEYLSGNMENISGNEKDLRTHLSLYLTPFVFNKIRPYFSMGIVLTNRKFEYSITNPTETKTKLNGRVGVGIDYALFNNIGLNADLGFYNDGYNFVGMTSSIGLRYNFNL